MFNKDKTTVQIRTFFIIWMILICICEVHTPVHFLILNTFLAYIPIELSFLLNRTSINHKIWFWPLSILWLLFYPNTPYLLTDLFHLTLLAPYNTTGLIRLSSQMWVNYTFLVVSALTCSLIGLVGLIKIANTLAHKFHFKSSISSSIITFILILLSSIGVFIGRFLRIHTIYLFISPRLFIMPLIKMWTPHMITFVCLFTFVQMVIYELIKFSNLNLSFKR